MNSCKLQEQELPPSTNDLKANQIESKCLRVLLIEDDINLLKVIELNFQSFSIPHQLYMTTNGYQGLLMTGLIRPHLILTDLKMPGIDGLTMINEILKCPETEKIKIIVITGLETRDIMSLGNLPENILILPKPVPFSTIETICHEQYQNMQISLQIPELFNSRKDLQ